MCIEETTPYPPFSPMQLPPVMRLKTPAAPEKGDDTAPGSDVQAEAEEERLILCRECLFPIAREEDQSAMEGGQQHTFANPAGIVLPLSGTLANAARAGMPMIRFQPDGFHDPSSPTALWLREEDGVGSASDDPAAGVVWITQTLNRTGYEIQTNQFAWVRR